MRDKKLLVLIADGTEEVEAVTIIDYLRRAGVEVTVASVMDGLEVTGAHDISLKAQILVEDVNWEDYDGVYSPGGLPGAFHIRDNDKVMEIYKKMYDNGKIVSALCAGPTVLDKAGVLKGRKYSCYPGFEGEIKDGEVQEDPVVRDANVITGRGPAVAHLLAYELIGALVGTGKKLEVEEDTLKTFACL